jgi:hypothetical protein
LSTLRKQLGLDKPRGERVAPARPIATPPPANGKKAAAATVEVPAKEVITHTCGHRIGVHYLRQQPCRDCANRARKEACMKRTAERTAQQEVAAREARLPDGSAFLVSYDAAKEMWSGELTVEVAGEVRTFRAECSGVMRLLRELDAMFRAAN